MLRNLLYTPTKKIKNAIVFGAMASFIILSKGTFAQAGYTKICSASDLHLFDRSLLVNDGPAFQSYLAQDRKLIAESEAITEALVGQIYSEAPEFFLITGDLTKDGEKISHQKMAFYLDSIEKNGITKVYVIPGNHDINNVDAHSYDGANYQKVDSVSPSDFKAIYNHFGYGEAALIDSISLSYLAKPKSNLWVIGMDACMYDSNMVAGTPVTKGRFKPNTYKWILDRLSEAKTANATVIGMLHHGLTEHYLGQSVVYSEYVVEGWDTISVRFADAGLKLVFTGHYHANDITKTNGTESNFVYDIETGSTVTWPCPYRVMYLNNTDKSFNVSTKFVTEINYNTNGQTFQQYAKDTLEHGLTNLVNYVLMTSYGLDAATASVLTPHVVNAYVAHYAGDEKIPADEQAFISYLASSSTTATFAYLLTCLWTDLNPSDNNIKLSLSDGTSENYSYVPVAGIELSLHTQILNVGEFVQALATINPIDATFKDIEWVSESQNIATVVNGLITGLSQGTTKIVAHTLDGNKTDTCLVEVRIPDAVNNKGITDALSIYPVPATNNLTVQIGNEFEVTAIRLVEISGKTVASIPVNGEKSIKIELQGYVKGIYLLQFDTKQGVMAHKIIIM